VPAPAIWPDSDLEEESRQLLPELRCVFFRGSLSVRPTDLRLTCTPPSRATERRGAPLAFRKVFSTAKVSLQAACRRRAAPTEGLQPRVSVRRRVRCSRELGRRNFQCASRVSDSTTPRCAAQPLARMFRRRFSEGRRSRPTDAAHLKSARSTFRVSASAAQMVAVAERAARSASAVR
jgi:hypothetical protein